MAVLVETRCRHASQSDFYVFNDRVEEAIGAMGEPPAGLMMALTSPIGDGFCVYEVWRTEAEMRAFHDAVMPAALSAAGLVSDPLVVSPVWGFSRP
ncbi:hypothetical protein OG474_41160 [Kribbella sp. NBC_01505]|uniref:hypothetical protein n=1 Tax=Kribbella sp. NBC_01505 TaxID=2903580 RepID=UPI00386662A0